MTADQQQKKGPSKPPPKTDAASIIARYMSIPPASARAIAAALDSGRRMVIETSGVTAAQVVGIVNAHLAQTDKAAADEANGAEETADQQ